MSESVKIISSFYVNSIFCLTWQQTNERTVFVLCKKCNEPVDSLEVDARATDDVPFGQIWQTVDYAPWHFRRLAQIATGTGGIAPCIPPCVHISLFSSVCQNRGHSYFLTEAAAV